MVKYQQKIFAICLVLLLTLSVGYAYFSDNINVTGMSKAPGTFKVSTICQPGVANFIKNSPTITDENDFTIENEYKQDSCVVLDYGKTVNFNVRLTNKDAFRYFSIELYNSGTTDFLFPLGASHDFITWGKISAYDYETNALDSGFEFDGSESSWKSYKSLSDYLSKYSLYGIDLLLTNGSYVLTKEETQYDYIGMTQDDEEEWFLVKPGMSVVLLYGVDMRVVNDPYYYVNEARLEFDLIQKTADFKTYREIEGM